MSKLDTHAHRNGNDDDRGTKRGLGQKRNSEGRGRKKEREAAGDGNGSQCEETMNHRQVFLVTWVGGCGGGRGVCECEDRR